MRRKEGRRRWRRPAAFAVLAAVLLTGIVRHLVRVHDAEPRFAVVSSRSSVLGTWRTEDGDHGRVEFSANGRFSAVRLPAEALTLSEGGSFTGTGRWSLLRGGGAVALLPDRPPSGMSQDASLAVVRSDGRVRLCVMSGSPGVLCDVLLRPVTGA